MAGRGKSAGKGDVGYAFAGGNKQLFRLTYPDKAQIVDKTSADSLFEGCRKMIVA